MAQQFNTTNGFWILPSRRRPKQLMCFLAAYKRTKATTAGVIVVDSSDWNDLQDEYKLLRDEFLPPNWHFRTSGDAERPGDKTRFIERHYKPYDSADWVGIISDDMEPVTPGWDLKLLSALTDKTWVSANDEWQAPLGRITGGVVFPKKLLDVIGGWYPADFKHYFVDDLLELLGNKTPCWRWARDVIIKHHHKLNSGNLDDSTYQKSSEVWEHDKLEYQRWLSEDYERTLAAILKHVGAEDYTKAKPSVMIATPCYGGMMSHHYAISLMKTTAELTRQGITYGICAIPNESLISRGRNRCATLALNAKVDKLFFIDADMGWEVEEFLAIYNSDKPVVGGTALMKQLKQFLVYNPLSEHVEELEKAGKLTVNVPHGTLEELGIMRDAFANEKGEMPVKHIGTAFMCIDLKVLEKLKEHVPSYTQFDTVDPTVITQHWDFFSVGVKNGQYESEDWSFCTNVREKLGYQIHLNTGVICTHTGTHTYKLEPEQRA